MHEPHQRHRSGRDPGVARGARLGARLRGAGPGAVPARQSFWRRRNARARRYRISANTPYLNTIPPEKEARHPGDRAVEHRIRSLIRWNAIATVLRANKESSELGGHIASFQSAATLYDVGFMHFWHARDRAARRRSRLSSRAIPRPASTRAPSWRAGSPRSRCSGFRQEVDGKGLSSYPHPWLMPDFWQFPTVSMGLGPIMAIYQARFLKYLHHRGLADTDEPQGLGLPRRRRDRRAGEPGRDLAWPGASGSTT